MTTDRMRVDAFVHNGTAYACNGTLLSEMAAQHGTPLYVYSATEFGRRYRAIEHALADLVSRDGEKPLVCYSVKANSNIGVLRTLAQQGAGFDIVSQGEMLRALEAGADPKKIVFAGVGKQDGELRAAIAAGVGLFNVESISELKRLQACAVELKREPGSVRVALRLNPDIDPETHSYITTGKKENKFGIDLAAASALGKNWPYDRLRLAGIHMHIGSQIRKAGHYSDAMSAAAGVVRDWATAGHILEVVNLGGGFSVDYEKGSAADFNLGTYAQAVERLFTDFGRPRLVVEPGRYISAASGVMLTRITYVKKAGGRSFYICDAGMNDLMRPSFYGAWHTIWPAAGHGEPPLPPAERKTDIPGLADVVGPICESGDFLALGRELPALNEGDLLVVFHAGAYGYTMSSNYNTRPRAAEVLVHDDGRVELVRRRETYDDLLGPERNL
ncbi:MAG: diaminopimelate decarboxylase [Planctomycetota bacterium]